MFTQSADTAGHHLGSQGPQRISLENQFNEVFAKLESSGEASKCKKRECTSALTLETDTSIGLHVCVALPPTKPSSSLP